MFIRFYNDWLIITNFYEQLKVVTQCSTLSVDETIEYYFQVIRIFNTFRDTYAEQFLFYKNIFISFLQWKFICTITKSIGSISLHLSLTVLKIHWTVLFIKISCFNWKFVHILKRLYLIDWINQFSPIS